MKKTYLSPQLVSYSVGKEDVILASLGTITTGIGGGDWGVQDEF